MYWILLEIMKKPAKQVKKEAFKKHMKDILEYRTMEYYRRRYLENGSR